MKKFLTLTVVVAILVGMLSFNVHAAPTSWAWPEITDAMREGLITEAVKKDYQKDITREEFCELAVKLYEKLTGQSAAVGEDVFTDTDNPEILKAYNLGIIKGISDTEVAPHNSITRQEICVMLVRCIDIASESADVTVFEENAFADNDEIAPWALESVNYAYDNAIIKGVGNNCIAPLGNTTCEQAIVMVYRVYISENVLNKLLGSYFPVKYLEKYKETKSAIESDEELFILFFYNDEIDKYTIMPGDGHQGLWNIGTVDKIVCEDGIYKISSRPNSNNESFSISYDPNSDIVYFKLNCPGLSQFFPKTLEQPYAMRKYDDIRIDMSKILFENAQNVTLKEDGAYAEINGKVYRILPEVDTVWDFSYQMEGADGVVYLYPVSGEEEDAFFALFSYENDTIRIFSETEGIDVTFEKN